MEQTRTLVYPEKENFLHFSTLSITLCLHVSFSSSILVQAQIFKQYFYSF